MQTFKVNPYMITVAHRNFKRTRYVTNSGRFGGNLIDAKRYAHRVEAETAAASLRVLWPEHTFTVTP